MIKLEIPVQQAQRFSYDGETPLNNFFSENKCDQIFDILLHQFFFIEEKDRMKFSYSFHKKFTHDISTPEKDGKKKGGKFLGVKILPILMKKKKEPKEVLECDSQSIDYSKKNTKLNDFFQIVSEIIKPENLRKGVSEEVYKQFWESMSYRDNVTAIITVLLGRLLKVEIDINRARRYSIKPTTNENVIEDVLAFFKLNEMSLEIAALLLEREKSLKTKVNVNSDLFGSFLQGQSQVTRKKYSIKDGKIIDSRLEDSGTGQSIRKSDKGKKKDKKRQTKGDEKGGELLKQNFSEDQLLERSAIMNLLLYITSLCNYNIKETGLLKIINEWKKIRHGESGFIPLNKEAKGKKGKKLVTLLVDTMHKSIEYCMDYDRICEFDKYVKPDINSFCPSGLFDSFNFVRVKNMIKTSPDYILKCVLNHLKLPNANITNIFTFLRYILSFSYLNGDECKAVLKDILDFVHPFFVEPLPIGGLARELIRLIKEELNFPNIHIRRTFSNVLGPRRRKPRTIHVLLNKYSSHANFINRFDFNVDPTLPSQIIHMKANLVLNVMADYLNNGKDVKFLLKTSPYVLAGFYFDVCDVIENESKKENINVSFIKQKLKEIQRKIEKSTTSKSTRKKPVIKGRKSSNSMRKGKLPPKLPSRKSKTKLPPTKPSFKRRRPVPSRALPQFVRNRLPEIPNVRFDLIEMDREDELSEEEKIKTTIPKTIYFDVLQNLIKETRKAIERDKEHDKQYGDGGKERENTIPIDIAIAGGSTTIQRFSHAVNICRNLKIMDGVIFRVFLIPLGEENYLSTWLSNFDNFYGRNFHNLVINKIGTFPCLKNVLRKDDFKNVTKLRSLCDNQLKWSKKTPKYFYNLRKSKEKEKDDNEPFELSKGKESNQYATPKHFYTLMLNNYVLSAQKQFPVSFYSTQCLTFEVKDDEKNVKRRTAKWVCMKSLSFCQRLEIGYYPQLYQHKKNEETSKFKFVPLNLSITYVPMSVNLDEKLKVTTKNNKQTQKAKKISVSNRSFYTINVKNLSKVCDLGEIVTPENHYLEVFMEDTKKRKKRIIEYDYDMTFRASEISIESNDHRTFVVMMDGEFAGAFHRILINRYKPGDNFFLQTFQKIRI